MRLALRERYAQSARQTEVPRLANGKPNFSGVWQALTTANWNVLTHGASAGPPEYGALLATPPGYGIVDGDEIPYLPAAAEQQRRNYENRFKDDPELKCYMPGVPRASYMPYPLQIFQSDRRLLIAYQFAGAARIVNLDKPQPSAIDSWMGVSNARWDGDTLVVDVSGFNGQSVARSRRQSRELGAPRRRALQVRGARCDRLLGDARRPEDCSLDRGPCIFGCSGIPTTRAADGVQVRSVHRRAALWRVLQAAEVTRSGK